MICPAAYGPLALVLCFALGLAAMPMVRITAALVEAMRNRT